MPSPTVFTGALNTFTRQAIEHKTYDQLFNSSVVMELLKNRIDRIAGGLYIQSQISYGKSPNTSFYNSQTGGWNIAPANDFATIAQNWSYTHDAAAISGIELDVNQDSTEEICSIIQTRLDNVMLSIVDFTATALIVNNPYGQSSDGTAGNPLGYEGLCVQVSDATVSPTVGGQSRTALGGVLNSQTNWANQLNASLISSLQALDTAANKGSMSRVNAIVSTSDVYNYYAGLLQPNERYIMDSRFMESNYGTKVSGMLNLSLNGMPFFYDNHIPNGVPSPVTGTGSGSYLYGLNLDTFRFIVSKQREFSIGNWFKDQFSDNYFVDVYLAAALECFRPNANYVSWIAHA